MLSLLLSWCDASQQQHIFPAQVLALIWPWSVHLAVIIGRQHPHQDGHIWGGNNNKNNILPTGRDGMGPRSDVSWLIFRLEKSADISMKWIPVKLANYKATYLAWAPTMQIVNIPIYPNLYTSWSCWCFFCVMVKVVGWFFSLLGDGHQSIPLRMRFPVLQKTMGMDQLNQHLGEIPVVPSNEGMNIHKHKCVFVGCLPGYQVFFCHTPRHGLDQEIGSLKTCGGCRQAELGAVRATGKTWINGLCMEISPQHIALYGTVPYSTSILGSWNSHWSFKTWIEF